MEEELPNQKEESKNEERKRDHIQRLHGLINFSKDSFPEYLMSEQTKYTEGYFSEEEIKKLHEMYVKLVKSYMMKLPVERLKHMENKVRFTTDFISKFPKVNPEALLYDDAIVLGLLTN